MTPQETKQLLSKLEDHLKAAPDFSPTDVAALHELVQAWKGWQSLGRAAKWLTTSLGLLAAAIGSVAAIWGMIKGVRLW